MSNLGPVPGTLRFPGRPRRPASPAPGRPPELEACFLRLLAALRRLGFGHLAGLLLVVAWLTPPSACAAEVPKQYKLEAVLLFNLARFVDWPREAFATTNAPLVIGLVGRDPFGQVLEQVVRGESVNGHPLRVKHCASVQDAEECQMVFISSSEHARAKTLVAALKTHPVLTVSDEEFFCRSAGGMVAFYVNNQHRLRVRLNLAAAKAAGLSVSAKLIQVAELENASSSLDCPPGFLVNRTPCVFALARGAVAGAGMDGKTHPLTGHGLRRGRSAG